MHPSKSGKRTRQALQFSKQPGLCWTDLYTGWQQSPYQPVITESALIGYMRLRVQVSGAVWASLNAVPATYAAVHIDEDDPIFRGKRCAYRANLNTWRVITVITELRDEKASQDILFFQPLVVSFVTITNTNHFDRVIRLDDIALYPRSIEKGKIRHLVLYFTGTYATPTPDTLVDIDSHSVKMLFGVIFFQDCTSLRYP
jgi:hypothetical protein